VHCTACISVCPTAALQVNRADMTVSFDSEKCIGCELCIPVCIYKAMEIQF
jgi:Fe-S-cluster-containing dehydrogenase component